MMKEGGSTPEDRIAFGFRLATARRPTERERAVLTNSLSHYLAEYRTDREAAVKYLAQGKHPRDESLDACELAAYTVIASLILQSR